MDSDYERNVKRYFFLSGASLAGTSPTRERAEHDFYATPFSTTRAILDAEPLEGSILEPAAGEGHISVILKERYPDNEIVSTELVSRADEFDCNIQYGIDFLKHDYGRKFDNVITNPPFSLAKEFIEKALCIARKKAIFFAKIQLLEGETRYPLFHHNPPARIYVFTRRQNPWRNGSPVDEKGHKWSSTMCFAWFVWETGYYGDPIIKWLWR